MGPKFSLIFYRVYDTGGFIGDVYEHARQVELEVMVQPFGTSIAKGKTAKFVSTHMIKIEYYFLSTAISC